MPCELNIEKLPGLKRGQHPAVYFRDEIVWNECGNRFALAYTIHEASFGNEVGHICWGRLRDGKIEVLGIFEQLLATCWQEPWCNWINKNAFAFKAHFYNGSPSPPNSAKLHLPIISIHFSQGYLVVPGTDNVDSRLGKDDFSSELKFRPQSEADLIQEIIKNY